MVFETASNLAEEHFAPEGQRNAVDKFGRVSGASRDDVTQQAKVCADFFPPSP
jgi:hypothetical protein